MPSFKPTKLWEASPHTLAKFEIIGRYLYLWFAIVGSNSKNRRLVYIDGFAGPGRYTNTDRSSDDTVGQKLMVFDFDAPAIWAEKMQQALGGKWRPYSDFRDFALTETPFINPKAMLRHLENQSSIEIEGEPNRRKGSFPEEKIRKLLIQKTLL